MLSNVFSYIAGHSLELQIFLVVFVTLLANYFAKKTLNVFLLKAGKTKTVWDDALIYALQRPTKILIFLLGFCAVLDLLYQDYQVEIFRAAETVRNLSIIFAVTITVLRFIQKSEQLFVAEHHYDSEKLNTINAVVKLLRISVFITAILILMQTLGINISGVLAFGGVSGIAVGFAAKDLLSNFFGALMIYLDKPFRVGDWIKSPDREIEGTVKQIGWRQTQIMSFEKRPIYVPNSVFSTIAVENPSRMSHRRIYETIGVRYDDFKSVENIVADIKSYLEKSKDIDSKQTIIVNFDKFADSALDIMVYCFAKETDWVKFHGVKQRVLLDIGQIIETHKAEIAYPTIKVESDQ